jgi:D-proline reductase (dithiol) PrdB
MQDLGTMTDQLGEETAGAASQRALDEERFMNWVDNIAQVHGARAVVNDDLYWAPLTKPLSESTVAILTSIGVHLKSDPPFDILDEGGDTSIRFIPGDVDTNDLMATHGHVDTQSVNEDINVALPLDRLREMAASGRVGRVAATHYGVMGWCPPVEKMRDEVAPQIIERLKSDAVDAVLLVPG